MCCSRRGRLNVLRNFDTQSSRRVVAWLTRCHSPGHAACRAAEKVLLPAPGTPTSSKTTGFIALTPSCLTTASLCSLPVCSAAGLGVVPACGLNSENYGDDVGNTPASCIRGVQYQPHYSSNKSAIGDKTVLPGCFKRSASAREAGVGFHV